MENLIIGFLTGIIIFAIIWQFFLKSRQDENKPDDTETKIDLARKEAFSFVDRDPDLEDTQNQPLKNAVQRLLGKHLPLIDII